MPKLDLTNAPPQIKALPIDSRGYPIPFFVAYPDGNPDHRIADGRKNVECARRRLCYVCGQPHQAGQYAFINGPVAFSNRYSSEPPNHLACALFALRFCPHLNNEKSQRRDAGKPVEARERLGMIDEKCPIVGLWVSQGYKIALNPLEPGFYVYRLGPGKVQWWRNGEPVHFSVGQQLAREWVTKHARERVDEEDRPRVLAKWLCNLGRLRSL
jgi:hypothetical protein